MAGYRTHISVSGSLGVAYGAATTYFLNFTPVQGALAGCLTWVAGMLPDLDSDTGKPVREVFGLVAAIAPLAMMGHLQAWAGGDRDMVILLAIVMYAAIRYGASYILFKLTVHRGMFHSIPAMLIAAELAFLAYKSDSVRVKLLMAGGVAIGFLSHLVLDEMYSIEWTGVRIRLNSAAGSAFKFVGKRFAPNALTYGLLMFLTYVTLVSGGWLQQPEMNRPMPWFRQAASEEPPRN